MNINRHNYETFFLLYTDNELPAAEKKAVDEFVDANPDLQEELVMLQQSVLMPDNILFDDKRSLLKNEFIPTQAQEKLFMYLDNELNPTQKNEIEGLINTDADIKKEWDILQQTKLTVSAIVFKDKQSLYRKETGRIVTFKWWRVAAAAVFIGFGLWSGLAYFNNTAKVVTPETAINIQTGPTHDTLKPVMPKTAAPVVSSKVNEKVNEKEVAVIKVNTKKATPPATIALPPKLAPGKLTKNDIQTTALTQPHSNNLPKPYFDNVNNIDRNKTITANVTPGKKTNNLVVNPGSNEIVNTGTEEHATDYASATSFTDNSEENNNRVLFMNEEKIKKTKLGGFFRKVRRVLERNTNIKPGDNKIKVANLEFAIQ
ncbi:MAG: hypothetical protein ABI707_09730 [Ferruginibacter sp.]